MTALARISEDNDDEESVFDYWTCVEIAARGITSTLTIWNKETTIEKRLGIHKLFKVT